MPVGGIRALSWAKYWSMEGHNVYVLTCKERENYIPTSPISETIPLNVNLIEINDIDGIVNSIFYIINNIHFHDKNIIRQDFINRFLQNMYVMKYIKFTINVLMEINVKINCYR